jgi:hypothetical protein
MINPSMSRSEGARKALLVRMEQMCARHAYMHISRSNQLSEVYGKGDITRLWHRIRYGIYNEWPFIQSTMVPSVFDESAKQGWLVGSMIRSFRGGGRIINIRQASKLQHGSACTTQVFVRCLMWGTPSSISYYHITTSIVAQPTATVLLRLLPAACSRPLL